MKKRLFFCLIFMVLLLPFIYAGETTYLQGDMNVDDKVDIGDGIYFLNHLFLGGPEIECLTCADFNQDLSIDLSDAISLFNFLFLGGPDPGIDSVAPGFEAEKNVMEIEGDDVNIDDYKEEDYYFTIICAKRDATYTIIEDNNDCEIPISISLKNTESATNKYLGCASDGKRDRINYRENVLCDRAEDDLIIIPSDKISKIEERDGVEKYTIYGGNGNDYIAGTDMIDLISGLGGDDLIFGKKGDDYLAGGVYCCISGQTMPLSQILYDSDGFDVILGGEGDDEIYGGDDGDILIGSEGGDKLFGFVREYYQIGSFDKFKDEEDNINLLFGGNGKDYAYGGTKEDYIFGGSGDDKAYGYEKPDIIFGDLNPLSKKEYDLKKIINNFYSDARRIYNKIKKDFKESEEYLALSDGKIPSETEEGGKDILFGGCGGDIILGGRGNDLIYGGDTEKECEIDNDWIFGGSGDDKAYGEKGRDIVYGGKGDDEIYGDLETVTASTISYEDYVCGGEGKDKIYGDSKGLESGCAQDHVAAGPREGDDAGSLEEIYGGCGNEDRDFFYLNGEGVIAKLMPPVDISDWEAEESIIPYTECEVLTKESAIDVNEIFAERCFIGKTWRGVSPSVLEETYPVIDGNSFTNILLPDCFPIGTPSPSPSTSPSP